MTMWTLFKPYETELKSNRPLDKVINGLKERAIFHDNSFVINAKTFSFYPGTKVNGRVSNNNNKTTVYIKISPSADFKAMAFILFLAVWVASTVVLILTIKENNFNVRLFVISTAVVLVLTGFLYLIMRLFLNFSIWTQKESIEGLISSD
jgi:hypothetical protein